MQIREVAQTRFSDMVNAPLFNIPAQIVFRTGKSPTTNDRVPDRPVMEKVFVEEDPMVVGRCWPSVFYEGLLPEAKVGEYPERSLVAGRASREDLPRQGRVVLADLFGDPLERHALSQDELDLLAFEVREVLVLHHGGSFCLLRFAGMQGLNAGSRR